MPTRICIPHPHPARTGGVRVRGFTLIELIMVIVMLGVLAVFAAPRMFDSSAFNARGLHDITLSYLRYAQKTAIAQRRTVGVIFTSNSVSLSIDATQPKNEALFKSCIPAGSCPALMGPDGKASGSVAGIGYAAATMGGVTCLATPAGFNFDALGQPVNTSGTPIATAQCMQVANAANAITVEAATGYVHE